MSVKKNMRIKKLFKLPSLALILLAACIMLAANNVHCSSSYIDDYFHPAAKMALNKIQQTFASSPSSSFSGSSLNGFNSVGNFLKSNNSIDQSVQQSSVRQAKVEIEPNKNEFVKLNTGSVQVAPESQAGELPVAASQPSEMIVSSSESLSEDPTTLASVLAKSSETAMSSEEEKSASFVELVEEAKGESATSEQPQVVSEATTDPAKTDTLTEASATTTTTTTTEQTNDPQIALLNEASIKDTESEAVAAVDASIGFGGSDLFGLATDTCYDEYGNARFCEPEFENIATERQVEVSSECGRPASRFCTTYVSEHNDQIRNCHICDAQHPKKRHPATFLTDMNNPNAPTCWVSAPISSALKNSSENESSRGELSKDNVTLTLNFDKKYEITYVSMQFCSLKPDSLAIYKSQDFGLTWTPYQFYSSQCMRMYQRQSGLATTKTATGQQDKFGPQIEALCVNSSSANNGGGGGGVGGSGQSMARIAFSTLDSTHSWAGKSSEMLAEAQIDRSSQLQDWMSATNIRIVLDRHQTSWIQSSLAQHRSQQPVGRSKQEELAENYKTQAAKSNSSAANEVATQLTPLETSLTNLSDTYNYALADLTVGGRCKCNGHASRCVHGDDGLLHCDCRHNTAGRDCERCAPFHFDRPWQRATLLDANPCQPCQCNGHSRKCHFDPELYQLSGKRSGGVCSSCRDNTAGRHCHYCKEGYTRDHSKPMSDKEACKLCDCHPVGSLGRVCNQTTSQCPCKEGVTGLECNRCAPGYQQSSSPSEPCIKLPENDINYEPTIEAAAGEDSTQSGNTPGGDQVPSVWTPGGGGGGGGGGESPLIETPETKATQTQDARHAQGDVQQGYFTNGNQLEDQFYGKNFQDEMGNSFNGGRARRPQQWNRNRARYNYYGKHKRPRIEYPNLDEMNSAGEDEEQEFQSQTRSHSMYNQAKRLGSARNQQNGAQDSDGLDYSDDYGSGQMIPSVSHATPPFEGSNDDQANVFNNYIQSVGSGSAPGNIGRNFRQHNNKQLSRANNRHHLQQVVGNRRRISSQNLDENSLACANCQSNGKRLRFKQFCQIDYAIKAQVLNMFMADDWTRFDVEIQDIFKSPNYEAQQTQLRQLSRPRNQANFIASDNSLTMMMQADDPIVSIQQANNTTKLVSSSGGGIHHHQHGLAPVPSLNRLKIGSIQSIWIPTEDVACNCPRLQLRTAYLLMGMVDSKENSVTSIQLDRHGIAIEWKPTLQERLTKYQRRYSKGRC